MRRLRDFVAMSLDAYIAGPDDEYDWIIMDPAIDFASFFQSIDTILMGRRTFDVTRGPAPAGIQQMRTYACSHARRIAETEGIMVTDDAVATVETPRRQPGKDIWLMGGGNLFRSLLAANQVDTIEVGIVPIRLGDGIPLLPAASPTVPLERTHTQSYPSSIVMVHYVVRRASQ